MIQENDCVDIAELSKRFEVSQMTIHRDLRELEESGEVSRVYGGAKAVARQETEPDAPQDDGSELLHADLPIEERFKRSLEFKRAIAAKAAALVEDGDVIAMDPSTTTLHMCSYLKDRHFSVVTPSLSVALQCSNMKNVQVILLGGTLRKSSLSVVGTQMNEMLDWMVINKCFLSSHAFSYSTGLTDFTMDEAAVKRNLIASSQKVYVLVDHTKIDREASYVACNYRNIDMIFTDAERFMDERQRECLRKYEAAGVEVVYSM